MRPASISLAAVAAIASACPAPAAELATAKANDPDALARQLSNPVAALISVPFQLNWDTGFDGGGDKTTLNIQPVVPVSIGDDWNLISRTILPVIWQSDVLPQGGSQSGLGDILQSFFFSPKAPTASGWIWGVGPVLQLPTGGSDFTLDQWGFGPTAVVLKQTAAGWTYGMLVNQVWGVSNSGSRPDVDATFVQPFLTKNIGPGRTAALNAEATHDRTGGQWTVPINATVSQVLPLGGQLVSFQLGARVYVETPRGGPDWGLRFSVTLLYPR